MVRLPQIRSNGKLTPEQLELRQLREEVKRLKMEKEILKNQKRRTNKIEDPDHDDIIGWIQDIAKFSGYDVVN